MPPRPMPPRPTRTPRPSRAASKKLVYEVVLSEDQGNFKFGKAELPDEAKPKIDEMVSQLKADPKDVFIEIEGHTDNVGRRSTTRSSAWSARKP